jgi:hypothetical protein
MTSSLALDAGLDDLDCSSIHTTGGELKSEAIEVERL